MVILRPARVKGGVMAGGVFNFADALAWRGEGVEWACEQLAAAAVSRPFRQQVCGLFATLEDIAFEQSDFVAAALFGRYRKLLDAACADNGLFAAAILRSGKEGKTCPSVARRAGVKATV